MKYCGVLWSIVEYCGDQTWMAAQCKSGLFPCGILKRPPPQYIHLQHLHHLQKLQVESNLWIVISLISIFKSDFLSVAKTRSHLGLWGSGLYLALIRSPRGQNVVALYIGNARSRRAAWGRNDWAQWNSRGGRCRGVLWSGGCRANEMLLFRLRLIGWNCALSNWAIKCEWLRQIIVLWLRDPQAIKT